MCFFFWDFFFSSLNCCISTCSSASSSSASSSFWRTRKKREARRQLFHAYVNGKDCTRRIWKCMSMRKINHIISLINAAIPWKILVSCRKIHNSMSLFFSSLQKQYYWCLRRKQFSTGLAVFCNDGETCFFFFSKGNIYMYTCEGRECSSLAEVNFLGERFRLAQLCHGGKWREWMFI